MIEAAQNAGHTSTAIETGGTIGTPNSCGPHRLVYAKCAPYQPPSVAMSTYSETSSSAIIVTK
ncbi:hypothetical protein CJJ17_12970 [Gordonia polyisoprenivorans]|nr:hypothetical protein CJJ17_12970 [Gordonia polyisoprenivorans]